MCNAGEMFTLPVQNHCRITGTWAQPTDMWSICCIRLRSCSYPLAVINLGSQDWCREIILGDPILGCWVQNKAMLNSIPFVHKKFNGLGSSRERYFPIPQTLLSPNHNRSGIPIFLCFIGVVVTQFCYSTFCYSFMLSSKKNHLNQSIDLLPTSAITQSTDLTSDSHM